MVRPAIRESATVASQRMCACQITFAGESGLTMHYFRNSHDTSSIHTRGGMLLQRNLKFTDLSAWHTIRWL